MVKIGIFIIPNLFLKKKILNLKKEVKKKFGFQTYTDHLPHCTLYVFKTLNKNIKHLKKIKRIPKNYQNIFILDKTDIFYNDPITKKNTFIIKIKKNKFLKDLQKNVLKKFRKYVFNSNDKYTNKVMRRNFRLYGYPFVNKNWKPHFTIASISPKKKQNDFIVNFKKLVFNKKHVLKNLSIYQINKSQHKLICKIKIS